MSGDVNEIENSIMSSLDMLLKNPILIISYFTTLIIISWQLTLFTIAIVPIMGWVMGTVGKKLKRGSLIAQGQWSDLMSQLEGNTRWSAHHQGFQRRKENEHPLHRIQQPIPQHHQPRQHPPANGTPDE